MRRSVNGLSRDVSEYRKIQAQAFDRKSEVKLDISKAKRELKELEKAVRQNVDGSEKAFKEKQRALEDLQEEYKRLTKVAKDASKAENKLHDDMIKSNNTRKTMAAQQTSMMESLAGAGLGNMLGSALTGSVNQSISSVYGSEVGGNISTVVGGVLSGASIGAIAGPIGSAVGAAVGGLTGAINALSEQQQRDDDRFKNEVDKLYNQVIQMQQQSLENGIGLAGKREQDMISFGTILGSKDNADRFLKDVQTFSARTPFEMNNLLDTSKKLLSYGYTQDEILGLMTKIGDTGSALGHSTDDMNWVATALGRMNSSNKTSLEFINMLEDRAIPAVDYLAESFGKSNGQIREMISKGLIPGAEAAKIIADSMGEQFAGNMNKQSATFEGLASSLKDTWNIIDQSMGDGYIKRRKEGMEKEIEQLSGTLGDKMREANSLIGEFKADLENKYQQSIIDAMSSAMETEDYKKAERENDGAEMGRIIAEARAKAEVAYQNSEGVKLLQESQMGLIQSIQSDVALNNQYLEFGKNMANQFSKGYAGVIEEIKKTNLLAIDEMNTLIKDKGSWFQKAQIQSTVPNTSSQAYSPNYRNPNVKGHATGLDRVPYNGYNAVLHEGERVLTKLETDKLDKGNLGTPVINISNMTVREEADIEKIATHLYSELRKHAVNA